MKRLQAREVGILGGKRTIVSGLYGRAMRKMKFMVVQRVSEELTIEIEAGRLHDPHTEEIIRTLLEPLIKSDAILLANSHYGLVKPLIKSIVPKASVIDPVRIATTELTHEIPHSSTGRGTTTYLTTGEPLEMKKQLDRLFGINVEVRSANLTEPKLAA